MTNAFTKVWLRTDTYIDNLSPKQRRMLRVMCERFFEAGRTYAREHKNEMVSQAPKHPADRPRRQEGGVL